ncbi:Chain_A [Hexamita inflata]|uniref:Leucine Rich Repeat Protein n=1 Tax=Hexamita inflata TaxID=28002 RepID=A0ABP1JXI0_9EUKA
MYNQHCYGTIANKYSLQRMLLEADINKIQELKQYIKQVNKIYLRDEILWITDNDSLTSFSFVDKIKFIKILVIINCQNIEFFPVPTQLQEFSLQNVNVNLNGIQQMKQLTSLQIANCQLFDISVLNQMVNIEELDLSMNNIEDINCLKGLKNLTSLNLNNNQIHDIQCLRALRKLHNLFLAHNNIVDIYALRYLDNLFELRMPSNYVINMYSLKYMKKLEILDLSRNKIKKYYFFRIITRDETKWQEKPTRKEICNANKLKLIHNINNMKYNFQMSKAEIKYKIELHKQSQQKTLMRIVNKYVRFTQKLADLIGFINSANCDQ